MEILYMTGAVIHLFNGQHKGSKVYNNNFEAGYLDEIHKLYRYAGNTIGNQASYTNIANCMNRKAVTNDLIL